VEMTGDGTIETAVQDMQGGAVDYVLKPFRLASARPQLDRALGIRRLRREKALLERQLAQRVDELARANADLEAFSSSISHDLRAPLQVIDGFSSELLQRHAQQLDERGMHYLERICNASSRMSDLIEGLLRLSRVGREALNMRRVRLSQVVEGVLRDLAATGQMPRDCVKVGLLPEVQGDPVLLAQVFFNLVSNACKFSSGCPDPQVEIGCERVDGESVLFVRDNGAGFDMAYAGQLFEPFRRLHTQQEFAGVGVGLSLVQRVVQRHGGRIWAQAAPGEGACFRFTLPQKAL